MTESRPYDKILDGLVEQLANIEHERWARWQRHMHSKGTKQPDGTLLISAELANRWERQMETSYGDLREAEKESDREQVREYLAVIKDALRK